jgi:hypothetical protein
MTHLWLACREARLLAWRAGERKEDSSFSEEKAAKRLLFSCSFNKVGRDQHACSRARNKSLFASFSSEKEESLFGLRITATR